MTQVLLVNRHRCFREALALVLSRLPDITAIEHDGLSTDVGKRQGAVDVALLGSHLSDVVVTRLRQTLVAFNPGVRIVVQTGGLRESRPWVRASAEVATVSESAGLDDLIAVVRGASA